MVDEVFPRRNLPGRAEEWGRTVERRIEVADRAWLGSGQSTDGTQRASTAGLEQLAGQIERLSAAYSQLPAVSSASASASGFALSPGWTTVASVSLPDGGKPLRNVVAYGNAALADPGSGGGSGGFAWPFSLDLVTSEYGPRSGGFHEGMDFAGGAAGAGNPIPAAGDGVVNTVNFSSGFGNYIIIYHGPKGLAQWDTYTLYAHMQSSSPLSVGNSVSMGQTVGYVGNTGNSFGAHLHFETHRVAQGGSIVWDNNNPSYTSNRTAMNPRDFMAEFSDGQGPSYDLNKVCRIMIDGVASREFLPFRNTFTPPILTNTFYPVWGRTYSGSGSVDVALQMYTEASLVSSGGNVAIISAEGIFS